MATANTNAQWTSLARGAHLLPAPNSGRLCWLLLVLLPGGTCLCMWQWMNSSGASPSFLRAARTWNARESLRKQPEQGVPRTESHSSTLREKPGHACDLNVNLRSGLTQGAALSQPGLQSALETPNGVLSRPRVRLPRSWRPLGF